jgi:cysteine desulfurase
MRSIYFDYNATTPLDGAVREAMLPFLGDVWGNPSSVHHVGRRARVFLDEARERAAAVLACKPSELVFTSGGTESNNLAVAGTARRLKSKGRHILASPIEHPSVLECLHQLVLGEGFEVTFLPVDRHGFVPVDALSRAIRPDTILVTIIAANNEIGTVQPVAELGALCREKGVLFHTDAVQWFGKEPFDAIEQFNADLVSVCGHKFHGPKGAGLLYHRSPFSPLPILVGGGHENELRAGTENISAIAGLIEALERFVRQPVFEKEALSPLVHLLSSSLSRIKDIHPVTPATSALGNTCSILVEGADSSAVLAGLDLEGICASSGSACSSGAHSPSHVISALGFSSALASSLIRFSLGRENTLDEVRLAASILPVIIERSRLSQ